MELVFIFIFLVALFLTIIAIPGYREGDALQLLWGCLEVIGAILLVILLMMILSWLFPSILNFVIPIWSVIALPLLYIGPRSIILTQQRRWARLKGLIAATVIVGLLYGGCWFLLKQSGA
jgi:hypothetical protein